MSGNSDVSKKRHCYVPWCSGMPKAIYCCINENCKKELICCERHQGTAGELIVDHFELDHKPEYDKLVSALEEKLGEITRKDGSN